MAKKHLLLLGLKLKQSTRKIRKYLSLSWPIFGLTILVGFLFVANYQAGTSLLGWDNLTPEFDPKQDFFRSLFSVWAQYRGTGLVSGQAQAAEILHSLAAWAFTSLNFDSTLFRYLWHFVSLYIGSIGAFALILHLISPKFDPQTSRSAAFLGSVYYLLNLASIQNFYTPFESFSVFYASLPWLLLALIRFLYQPNLKHYFFLFVINFLATPAFFIQTLFLVYFFCLIPILISFWFQKQSLSKRLTPTLISGFSILLINLFWLLPVIFFVLTKTQDVLGARINLISSSETYQRNLEYANLENLFGLKGYMFSFLDLSSNNKYDYLLSNWRNHLNQPLIKFIQLFFTFLTITGLLYSFRKKLPASYTMTSIALISAFFLLGGGLFINSSFPVLAELFRSPWTKFSLPLSLVFSFYFSVGIIFVLDLFSNLHQRFTYHLTQFSVLIIVLIYASPAFIGQFISPSMRVNIPSNYQETYNFFQQQDPSTRIANFPQYTFWGWHYFNWGYRGSGFAWYGLKQPILDRAFDVWEKTNQDYYQELESALYSLNGQDFANVLQKYSVDWILVDHQEISPAPNVDIGLDKLFTIVKDNPDFDLEFESSDSQIEVYRFKPTQNVKNFLSTTDQLDTQLSPFALPSLRPQTNFVFDQNSLSLAANIPAGKIILPSLSDSEELLPYTVSYRKTPKGIDLLFSPQTPLIYINDKVVNLDRTPLQVNFEINNPSGSLVLGMNDYFLELQLPDEVTYQNEFSKFTTIYLPTNKAFPLELYSGSPVLTKDITTALQNATPQDCYVHKPNRKIEKVSERDQVTLITTDNVACLSAAIPPATSADQIISLEFVYSSDTNIPGNANITNAQLDSQTIPQPLKPSNTPTYTKLYSRPLFENMYANLLLEANELKSSQTITYKQIKVKYYDRLANSIPTLPPIRTNTLESTSSAILTVSLPTPNSKLLTIQNASNNLLGEEVRNCDNFNDGKVSQTIDLQGLTLESTNAIACKQLNLRHLPHNLNYVIVADHRYIEGLSSTICFENHATRRCDVFERLLKTDKPQLLINPIRNPSEHAGYTLHLFNQSVGSQSTKNLFQSLAIIPVPLTWLEKISVNQATPPATKSVESTHPAEFIYTVHFSDPKEQILNLYQTKSLHWLALEVDDNFHKLPLASQILDLPLQVYRNSSKLIFNTDHSNWHNAFKLSNQNQNLVIFYWPQYLQFLGFILLPIPLILMLLISLFKFVKKTIKKSSR